MKNKTFAMIGALLMFAGTLGVNGLHVKASPNGAEQITGNGVSVIFSREEGTVQLFRTDADGNQTVMTQRSQVSIPVVNGQEVTDFSDFQRNRGCGSGEPDDNHLCFQRYRASEVGSDPNRG